MSTKIYHGYEVLLPPADVVAADSEWFRDLQTRVRENAAKAASVFVATQTARLVDSEHPPENAITRAHMDLMDRYHKVYAQDVRDHEVDFDLHVTFFPLRSRPDSVLCLAFEDNASVFEIWRTAPNVREYRYWNNEDTPDHVTPEEWQSRRDTWNSVLPGAAAPDTSGYTRECLGLYGVPIPSKNDVISHLPSTMERALWKAEDTLLSAHYDERRSISALAAYKQTPEFTARALELAIDIEPKLRDIRAYLK